MRGRAGGAGRAFRNNALGADRRHLLDADRALHDCRADNRSRTVHGRVGRSGLAVGRDGHNRTTDELAAIDVLRARQDRGRRHETGRAVAVQAGAETGRIAGTVGRGTVAAAVSGRAVTAPIATAIGWCAEARILATIGHRIARETAEYRANGRAFLAIAGTREVGTDHAAKASADACAKQVVAVEAGIELACVRVAVIIAPAVAVGRAEQAARERANGRAFRAVAGRGDLAAENGAEARTRRAAENGVVVEIAEQLRVGGGRDGDECERGGAA